MLRASRTNYPAPLLLVLCLAAVGVLVDLGSVLMTRMSTPDQVSSIAHVAAVTVQRQPITRHTALNGHQAAIADARQYGITVLARGFTIYPDGRVKLTGTKTAPTLLLHRVPALQHLAEVSTTVTVRPLHYTS